MNLPEQTFALIAEFEGFRSHAYKCSAGVWTIGYGTTNAARLMQIGPGSVVTEPQALNMMRRTVQKFMDALEPWFEREPSDAQRAAMASLAYNIGAGAFVRSTVLRKFNAGDILGAGQAFLSWNKATVKGRKVTLPGLANRRERERSVFLGLVPLSVYG